MKGKSFIAISFLLLSYLSLASQQKVDSDVFLESNLNALQQESETLGSDLNFPWINEIELRTETRDFDLDKQEYTLRVRPSTPMIRKAQKALNLHYRSDPNENALEFYDDFVLDLYLDWISIFLISEEHKLLSELELVLKDKKLILERQMGIYNIDVKDLVDLELDRNTLIQTIFELNIEQEDLFEKYGLNEEQIDFTGIAPISKIESQINAVAFNNNSPDIQDILYEQDGIQKEIDLELAEGKQILDFAQLRYQGPHSKMLDEKLSIGIGFAIPNSGNRKLKIERFKLEKDQLDLRLKSESASRELRLLEETKELNRDIKIYKNFIKLKTKERGELDKIASLVKKKSGYDPMLILEINESILQGELKSVKYLEDIYLNYLKVLSISGALSANPFKNYLKV